MTGNQDGDALADTVSHTHDDHRSKQGMCMRTAVCSEPVPKKHQRATCVLVAQRYGR